MTSLNVVAFTVLACVGEMLVCLLSIRDASIPSEKLVPAILGVVFAWLVVGWLLNRTYDTDRASAARILKWPSTAFAVVWAVAAGIALVQASQVQLAWLWGGHGLLAVCFGLTNGTHSPPPPPEAGVWIHPQKLTAHYRERCFSRGQRSAEEDHCDGERGTTATS